MAVWGLLSKFANIPSRKVQMQETKLNSMAILARAVKAIVVQMALKIDLFTIGLLEAMRRPDA